MLEKEYLDITFLVNEGFERKRCPSCGKYFWTKNPERQVCGDPPCEPYSFIGNPMFRKKFDLSSMREEFLSFFEKRGHERIDPYPVIARWRDDIYLTIASIADFQPFVTSGQVPPPANPLVISQPCIRLDDLDSVGKTGRHLTLFEMMAHHAFNSPEKEVYWKNETVELCRDFLNELGVKDEHIIFKEEPWAGGGNAGPCLETIVGGLELATLVFMNLEIYDDGDIEIKGERYRKMDNYIVDTGYGLERFVWASSGSPTVYDAIFPSVIKEIRSSADILTGFSENELKRIIAESSKLAGVMGDLRGKKLIQLRDELAQRIGISADELHNALSPVEKIYALADHSRCLLFMLGDGLVPSNSGAGYLGRLVIRRSLRMMEDLQLELELEDLVEMHAETMKEFDFRRKLRLIRDMLKHEKRRYRQTVERGIRLVERRLRKKSIMSDELVELYDSHGIPPDLVKSIAEKNQIKIDMPDDFYSLLAERHMKAEKEKKTIEPELIDRFPKTEKLYYDNPYQKSFEAVILGIRDNAIILDRTAFYPESGGQDNDTGYLYTQQGSVRVTDVQESGGIVLHIVEDPSVLNTGEVVKGEIDMERRKRHMRHHTATHIILYSARRVLGDHIWQAGARKEEDRARLDITHYKKITPGELRKIERIANEIVMSNRKVRWQWMDRIEAEKKFGFVLYQGGVPGGEKIRVVQVGRDVQACGGTHCTTTGEVGAIKILRVDRIQDGVERLEFSAGISAIEQMQKRDEILNLASRTLRVTPEKLPETVQRFFEEWKSQKKQIEKMAEELAVLRSREILSRAERVGDLKLVTEIFDDADMEELIKTADMLKGERDVVAILVSKNNLRIVTVCGENARRKGILARDLIRIITGKIGGGGGGREDIAQGGGTDSRLLNDAIRTAIEFVKGKA